ncbi:hypothetical protein RB200_24855 [Streptomyces sp. PmtG]
MELGAAVRTLRQRGYAVRFGAWAHRLAASSPQPVLTCPTHGPWGARPPRAVPDWCARTTRYRNTAPHALTTFGATLLDCPRGLWGLSRG